MQRRVLLFLIFTIIILWGCNSTKKKDVYSVSWESIQKYEVPGWFKDAKFGIFIHWGPYSVPAFQSEWYPRLMYQDSVLWHRTDPERSIPGTSTVYKHHIEKYGHPSKFGYKDFIPMFKAEKFAPKQWVNLFKKSGAKYVIQVAEHHDAFAMYNSNVTRWNSVEMGPGRDIVRELSKASKSAGLKFGVSSHFAFNWDYFNREKRFDTGNEEYADLYGPAHERYAPVDKEFLDLWWRRTVDIIDNYKPDIFWFDFYFDRPEFTPYHPKLAAYYYNKGVEWKKEVVLQSKNLDFTSFPAGANVLDIERGKFSDVNDNIWQTDTSIGKNSWGYTSSWQSKSANCIIDDLIDIVSKNGNMLLSVGPKADGTIPQDQEGVLLEIGKWLEMNGDAIYDTKPWVISGEGPTKLLKQGHLNENMENSYTERDIRFTQSKDNNTLYITVLDKPKQNTVNVIKLGYVFPYLGRRIESIKLIGSKQKIEWKRENYGLLIEFPEDVKGDHAWCYKVKLASENKSW